VVIVGFAEGSDKRRTPMTAARSKRTCGSPRPVGILRNAMPLSREQRAQYPRISLRCQSRSTAAAAG
jgi:hypothetical protein